MPERPDDGLAGELRALGRAVSTAPPADLAARVLAAIADDAPGRRSLRRWWRPAGSGSGRPAGSGPGSGRPAGSGSVRDPAAGAGRPAAARWRVRWSRPVAAVLAVLLAAALAVLATSPPVRAAIRHLFAGVEVRHDTPPTPAVRPSLPGEHPADLAGAAREVGFPILVPAALGRPDAVTVADGRVVSLVWHRPGGDVRVDEFAGDLGVMFDKYTYGPATRTTVGSAPALWFDGPTFLEYVDADGRMHPESTRLTGHTLVWTVGRVTLRLDGVPAEADAVAVAAGAR